MSKFSLITKGLLKENPTFVLVLGMCPTLATTTSAMNGLEMGLATMFVLILSNIVISLIAPVVPDKVHIPVYIVVIATFVTVLQLLMQAFTPDVYKTLGLFIPLIVVGQIAVFVLRLESGMPILIDLHIAFQTQVHMPPIGRTGGAFGLIAVPAHMDITTEFHLRIFDLCLFLLVGRRIFRCWRSTSGTENAFDPL